jgi:YidC/Oxa1 family membrane protein insertase
MDRKSLIAIVLITVVVIGWMIWQQSQIEPPEPTAKDTTDTVENTQQREIKTDQELEDQAMNEEEIAATDTLDKAEVKNKKLIRQFGPSFAPFANGSEKIITIENELVKAKITSRGLSILKWQLKNYDKWDGAPTQLIWNNDGELYISFVSMEGAKIDSRELYFELEDDYKDNYRITGEEKLTLSAKVEVSPGKYLRKTITFTGNSYVTTQNIEINNLDELIPSRGYDYVWSDGLRYQEGNSVDESQSALGMVSQNEDIAEVNTSDDPIEEEFTGIIDYAAVKIKYFGVAAIPEPGREYDGTVDIFGDHETVKNDGQVEKYGFAYRIPYDGGKKVNTFDIFIGPLEYDIVKSLGLQEMVSLGWRYGIRQIGEYFMLPLFSFIHKYVPNYGVSIIIFAFLIKLLLYPLSIQQMRFASKMKLLQPEMEKLREKYKDDNTKQSQETMKLYSQYGVNPMGGCFPMLLQMPILFALWSVLRNAIDLRQSEFIWWITDLSTPDKIIDFGFSFLGISHLSGLALAMGIAMFFQQKLTITDPRQKAMIYMMPVMFTFMFSNFPAGLNLYYFMFNILGISQQIYINKFSRNKLSLADMKKSPKKEGWFQRKMREAQEMAEQQGRSVPGQAGKSYQNKNRGNQRKKKKK